MTEIDKRLNAYRPDLADARLKGLVTAKSFTEGRLMQVSEPLISIRSAPRFDARQLTQALLGEYVRVFDVQEGWAFVQLERDRYVGFAASDALTLEIAEPTHLVSVPSTFLYPAPDLKTQPVIVATLNAAVTVTGGDEKFAQISNGHFVYAPHTKPIGEFHTDFVAVAEMFRHVPYYWGGKSAHGLDCSGLLQLSLEACGIGCMRDSDMQEENIGERLPVNDLDHLMRGDMVFWDGHVGIMTGRQTLLHANGHHMLTLAEPLRHAIDRIAATGKSITSVKRLQ